MVNTRRMCRLAVAGIALLLAVCGGTPKEEVVSRLMEAAAVGDTTALAAALSTGIRVDCANDSGATALMLACRNGKTPVVRFLLIRRADPNRTDARGRTPLLYALSPVGSDSATPEITELLIRAGANPNAQSGPAPALVTAAFLPTKALEVSRLLLDHGAWVDIRDLKGRSALMVAVQQNKIELVQYLLTQGADMNARDHSGMSVVRYAMRKPEILGILFRSGARPR